MSIERVTAVVLEHAARGDALSPAAIVFLVRRYRAATHPDVSDVLGGALAVALGEHVQERTIVSRAAWLRAFAEALTVSEDSRLADAARSLVDGLAREWPTRAVVDGAASVDACLFAAHLVDARDLVPRAIDELERIVAARYQPGEPFGDPTETVCCAATLLTAFEQTGRLPYSMLAEELMQNVVAQLRPITSGTELRGRSATEVRAREDFDLCCDAARVLCRLAALHDDDGYRAAAVTKPGVDYRADAEGILEQAAANLDDSGADAARYGLALSECSRSS